MLTFCATNRQWAALEGLAYWIASNAWCRERMSTDEYMAEEHRRHDDTIKAAFDRLDGLGVPYWVQNAVIHWAEDWRRYKAQYMDYGLKKLGYDIRLMMASWSRAETDPPGSVAENRRTAFRNHFEGRLKP